MNAQNDKRRSRDYSKSFYELSHFLVVIACDFLHKWHSGTSIFRISICMEKMQLTKLPIGLINLLEAASVVLLLQLSSKNQVRVLF